jgi:hypothetical protein
VLRILVTGGPPVFIGGGIRQRIKTISRSSPALRITGVVGLDAQTAGLSRRTTIVDPLMYPPSGVGTRTCSRQTLKSR